jgi:predicted HicB family RNase H-like nuclease
MAKSEEVVWVQLATRIPKALHRKLKVHCVTAEASVMDFVTKAIGEKLAASSGTPTKEVKPYGRPSR